MDQERMLKSMATGASIPLSAADGISSIVELTNEIRGERLRFVEAMQEATAINVQSTYTVPLSGASQC